MALDNAVQGARHTGQRITWTRADGTAQDLTGSALTGIIQSIPLEVERDIDGDLDIVTAGSGIFDWTYGESDVAEAGMFRVQFKATYDDGFDLSDPADWRVGVALEVEEE